MRRLIVVCCGVLFCVAGAADATGGVAVWSARTFDAVNDFGGVSCTSSTSCFAVGSKGSATSPVARWDGTRWSIQSTAYLPGDVPGGVGAVSCWSDSACIAVGGYTKNDSMGFPLDRPLAERWDGKHWSIQTPPFPRNGSDQNPLNAVSCTSSSACTAVGSAVHAFAERWNGKRWSLETMPIASGAESTVMNAVSCTSSSACTAVGDSYIKQFNGGNGNPIVMLAERWNGKRWSIQTTPSPLGAANSEFVGVSCPDEGTLHRSGILGVGPRRESRNTGGALGR